MLNRREMLIGVGAASSLVSLAGCSESDGANDGGSGTDQESPAIGPQGGEDEAETENCTTETEDRSEIVVDATEQIEGGFRWTHGYTAEENDRVHFDIAESAGQKLEVAIDSPQGQTVSTEQGYGTSSTQQIRESGTGEVRITNLGERTEEEREELWQDRQQVSAGATLSPWAEISEGNHVEYYVREVSGARPLLRIEDNAGNVLREHNVASAIEDRFTAPEDGRYYFVMENTAVVNTGTWDYEFERVNEVPISTEVDLTIEREYEETVETCE